MKRRTVLKKIHLQSLIDMLVNVYNTGADFVDIEGCTDVEQDVIGIIIREEYFNVEDMKDEEEYHSLSQDDINLLLN